MSPPFAKIGGRDVDSQTPKPHRQAALRREAQRFPPLEQLGAPARMPDKRKDDYMVTGFEFVPLPDEGTKVFGALKKHKECDVGAYRGEAPNPCAVAIAHSDKPWCPNITPIAWR